MASKQLPAKLARRHIEAAAKLETRLLQRPEHTIAFIKHCLRPEDHLPAVRKDHKAGFTRLIVADTGIESRCKEFRRYAQYLRLTHFPCFYGAEMRYIRRYEHARRVGISLSEGNDLACAVQLIGAHADDHCILVAADRQTRL